MFARVSTGIPGLDRMLEGGLPSGRTYVLSGPPGAGKSTVCGHFLVDGLRRGEPVLFVALDEPPSDVRTSWSQFGWNLDDAILVDATPDIRNPQKMVGVKDVATSMEVRGFGEIIDVRKSQMIKAVEVSLQGVQKMIYQAQKNLLDRGQPGLQRIVLDSFTSLRMFALEGLDPRQLLESFFRFVAELGATTLVVSERTAPDAMETEFFMARGEIRLHRWTGLRGVHRAVSIERVRGSAFDEALRPARIDDHGLTVDAGGRVTFDGFNTNLLIDPFLEARLQDQVHRLLEEALTAVEAARKRGAPISDLNGRLLRATADFSRHRYEAALRESILLRDEAQARPAEAPRRKPGKREP